MSNKLSYTAASALPAKLIMNPDLTARVRSGFVPPVHVQLNPTNRCNLNCSFCSCSERDRQAELDADAILEAMLRFAHLGCKAVTITGGGEPLMHPNINLLIHSISNGLGIKVGLVSNGTRLRNLGCGDSVTWCRISSSDDREPAWDQIEAAVRLNPNINWAFSHVLTSKPDWERLGRLVDFANRHNFTHVRIVADLLDLDLSSAYVKSARTYLKGQDIDDHLVIYQDRASYVHGRPRCGISLLKPVLGADGGIYPCCGVQYAQDPPGRDLVPEMRMGEIGDIESIWKQQMAFDGSVCGRCYYDDYNMALDMLQSPICHEEFV